ncbi:MAG TPA: hypothetical protein ENH55_14335 [Aurantimonas coralicida]|uniref:Uncharacterized protein n=2 Tax=root TaxID=1 RepID=A0A9C9TIT4_9HYPH|nr:hypothetical protein [Aurantimonas coralicida]HEU02702.1 hypothetical protein [Aurantimonas coralicida]
MTAITSLSIRSLLMIDAAACGLMGTLLMTASRPLQALTRIPVELLFYAGAILFPIAAFMAIAAAFPQPQLAAVWTVILGNLAWIAASIILPFTLISPNALGWAFLLGQAAVVAVLAKLERDAVGRMVAT